MAFTAFAEKNRTVDLTVLLYESDGSTSITIAATDVVRCKIGRRPSAQPDLDIDSAAATSNGSSITVDETGTSPVAQVTIRLAQADLSGLVGTAYDMEVTVVDDSETAPTDAIKSVQRGTLVLEETLGGSVGKT